MNRLFLAALLLASLPYLAPAAEPRQERFEPVRARMKKFVDDGQIPGAVTVVGNSKEVLAFDAVGRAAEQRKMAQNDIFRIASMTKPITALGVMILADEKKLSVEDPVEKHLPEFRGQMMVASKDKDTVTLRKPSRPITIRDLLTHTSGLPAYPVGISGVYVDRRLTLAEAVFAVSQRPLDFEPGSKWAYCNSGIDTLGRIIEVVSGQPYEAFLAKRLFEPLGMKDTTFVLSDEQRGRLAGLYTRKNDKLTTAPDTLIGPGKPGKHPIPAGGLYSTGEDLAKLYQMMLNRGKAGGKQLVSEDGVKAMTRVQTGDLKTGFTEGMGFGFGWAVVRKPQGVTEMLSPGTYGHGGAFGTQAWIDPEKGTYFVLLIQMTGLPNADASEMRREFQKLSVEALKK